MCGIIGKIGKLFSRERLLAAMQKMSHRGPDQDGHLYQNGVSFGHRRLSIIDLSEDGRQPMSNEDGTVWLVFNGEIYNFLELRPMLEGQHDFKSRTDSEVLIHGYEQWGIEGLLERIRGMFAFAIWDEPRATLHLVRDHLGKKPLFYSILGGGLSFASTLPALLELLGTTPEVSRQAIVEYLTYLSVPSPRSMFEGVFKLPPAHRLEFRLNQEPRIIRYWRPDLSEKEIVTENEWLERIDATLKDAVRERLIADVPLGAFLSGGVDSSLVVALMTELSGRPVTTVSMGFEEERFSELPYARRVAQVCNSDHHEYTLRPNAASVLPALTFHYGEPFADHSALPTYYLAQAAREHVTVVLTGDGGDENFAGYQTHQAVALSHLLHRMPGMRGGQIATALHAIERRGLKNVRKLRWIAELARSENGNYVFDPVAARTFRAHQELFGPALKAHKEESDELYRRLWESANDLEWLDRALYIDLMTQLPNTFLVKVDVATMAHGLEARSPFLDLRVIALSSRIPSTLKLKYGRSKYLLKRLAERYLPKEILYRPKQGFSLPISDWLRSDLGQLLNPILLSDAARHRDYFEPKVVARFISEHKEGKADHGQRLWLLLILELWFRMFIDGELTPSDNLLDMVKAKGGS